MDTCRPTVSHACITIDSVRFPSSTNRLGASTGEFGTVASTPAVVNAVLDALAPLGIADVPMPAAPERICRAIRDPAAMPRA
jgi:aerobic carbon-monoxide dehydrogenase large subunit